MASASAWVSFSEPKARMPWTSSGSTTSSWGMWGMLKLRSFLFPRSPTVPGEPMGRVGNRLRTPFFSSTAIWRKRTERGGMSIMRSSLP